MDVNLAGFYNTSSLECLILGQVNLLETEITETNIGVPRDSDGPAGQSIGPVVSNDLFHTGTLPNILRVRRFGREDGVYKSDI